MQWVDVDLVCRLYNMALYSFTASIISAEATDAGCPGNLGRLTPATAC